MMLLKTQMIRVKNASGQAYDTFGEGVGLKPAVTARVSLQHAIGNAFSSEALVGLTLAIEPKYSSIEGTWNRWYYNVTQGGHADVGGYTLFPTVFHNYDHVPKIDAIVGFTVPLILYPSAYPTPLQLYIKFN